MPASEGRACPHCGSSETTSFADGSGVCRSCGRAFRGDAVKGEGTKGPSPDASSTSPRVRLQEKLGLLGVFGGLLGYAGIPGFFLIGSALSRQHASTYVESLINTPRAAIVCGGLSLLLVAATYALWAGSLVWRGHAEAYLHLLFAGIVGLVAGFIAGPVHSLVGIFGASLTLAGGGLVLRKARTHVASSPQEASASTNP